MLDHAKRLGWTLPTHNSFVIPNLIRDAKDVFRSERGGAGVNGVDVDGGGQHAEAKAESSSKEGLPDESGVVDFASECGSEVQELVFLGRLEPRKGLAVMVDAMQLVARALSPSHTMVPTGPGVVHSTRSRRAKPLHGLTVSFMGRSVSDPALGDTASWVKAQHAASGWGGARVRAARAVRHFVRSRLQWI